MEYRTLPGDATPVASDSYVRTSGSNQLASVTMAAGTRSIAYDARGNTNTETRPGSVAVAAGYDGYGRLTDYARTGEPIQANAYNGLDDRVNVTSGSTTSHYLYDMDGRLLGEYGASASAPDVIAETIWMEPEAGAAHQPFGGDDGLGGYMPLAVAVPDGTGSTELLWVHGNHLGVPVLYTDGSGTTVATPAYALPGFPGQMRTFSDLYYNRHRDYDPTLGRYIQADPIGLEGGSNPYLYAGGNPVTGFDPMGLEKYNLFPFGEPIMQAAADRQYERLPPSIRDGMIHIFGHSNAKVFCVHSRTGPTCLTPEEFVSWMKINHVTNKPIMLWGCLSGSGDSSFAERLSLRLRNRVVVAATGNTLWSIGWRGTGFGTSQGFMGIRNGGEWRRFGGRQ